MAKKLALVDYNRCRPAECNNGVCPAAQACERKLLKQEVPGEIPMTDPALCRGCADCARACPQQAIQVVTV